MIVMNLSIRKKECEKRRFNVKTGDVLKEQVDLAVVFADEKAELPEKLSELFLADDFSGKPKQTLLLYTRNAVLPSRVLCWWDWVNQMKLLLIPFRMQQPSPSKTIRLKAERVSFAMFGETDVDEPVLARAIVEGAVLGSYRFLDYKTD